MTARLRSPGPQASGPRSVLPLSDLARSVLARSILGLSILASAGATLATAHAETPQQCAVQWNDLNKTGQTGPLTYRTFMSNCLAGRAPSILPTIDAPAGAPVNATARCRDGTYTTTTVRQGACVQHRGVAALLR